MSMNKLSTAEWVRVLSGLIEGNNIASMVCMIGIAKTKILRMIRHLGRACENFHDERAKNLGTKRIEMDELWAFIGVKDKADTPPLT
jgi:hypothetical protein